MVLYAGVSPRETTALKAICIKLWTCFHQKGKSQPALPEFPVTTTAQRVQLFWSCLHILSAKALVDKIYAVSGSKS